jgi:hypothetical protein
MQSVALAALAKFLPREGRFVGAGDALLYVDARPALEHLYAFPDLGFGLTLEEMRAIVGLAWASARVLWKSERSEGWRVDLTPLGVRMRDQLARSEAR